MKTKFVLMGVACIVLLTLCILVLYNNKAEEVNETQHIVPIQVTPPAQQTTMNLTSSAFGQNQMIPSTYTCDAANSSPDLDWSGVPAGTVSLALIMDDPDVPTSIKPDGIFVHWVVFNIDPSVTGVSASSTLEGTQGLNGAGKSGYIGPCPPDREHRYFFKLYALDQKLDLPRGASKTDVEAKMTGHILQQAELMARYDKLERQKKVSE